MKFRRIQISLNVPFASRYLTNMVPQLFPTLWIMPKRLSSTRIAFPPILPRLLIPWLLSANHRPRPWRQQLNNSSCDLLLLLKPKKVEKSTGIDDIYLPLQLRQFWSIVEDIGCYKSRLQSILVFEQFIANGKATTIKVRAVCVLRRCAVEDELTNFLPKTAAWI